MRRIVEKILKKRTVKIIPISLLLLIIVSTLLVSCRASEPSDEQKRNHPSAKQVNIGTPNFMPDNNDIIIFECAMVFSSKLVTYNLKTGKFTKFENIPFKQAFFASYSSDAKKIVFLGALDEYGHNRNIYIMNADGSDIRQITNFDFTRQKDGNLETSNKVRAPSFSPDGKRILYAKSRFKRERAYPLSGTMDTAWDVYEIDVATGKERRLTNYDFYEMSWPHYMPDGKRFIFSAEGPVNTKGKGPKDFREYEELYQKNFIFIMDGIDNKIKPAFTYGSNSARPCVMPNGAIIFVSQVTPKENSKATQELFIYENGQVRQLTQMAAWISNASISSDGKYIWFSKRLDKNTYDYSQWLMNSDGTGLREIKIPLNLLKQESSKTGNVI